MTNNEMPPLKVGFFIDNELVDFMFTDSRWGAIFLSEPKMIDLTGIDIRIGSILNPETGEFTEPVVSDIE
jgi:hypothetical protein